MRSVIQAAYLIGIACMGTVSSAHAGGGGSSSAVGGDATERTQMLNNAELLVHSAQLAQEVQNTAYQVQMMQQQLKNLISAPQMVWSQAQSSLMDLTRLVSHGQALGYQINAVDRAFAQRFPGYARTAPANFRQASREWTATSLDSLQAALRVAGMQSDQFATEQSSMNQIQSIAAGSPGALQAVQAGIMVSGQQVEQLQKLRQLNMAQMQAQNAYLAKKEQQEADEQMLIEQQFPVYVPTPPTFRSSGGKN